MSGRLFQVDVGSLDSKQISQHFSLLLDELAITDDKVRSQWESEYTVAQKTSVLEHLQDDSKKNEVPLDFVTGLKKNAFEIEFLEDLLDKLSTSDEKWVDEFVEANGLLWLVEFIIVSFNEINSSVRQALSKGFDPSKLELILSCISQLVNESSEGLNKLLTVKGGFIHIANCLEYVSVEKKVTILEILSACCLESESSWGLVVDALNGFCLSRPKYFASMIDDDFINGDSFDFKIAYMMLINTLIVNGPDLLSRITIRERFMVFKGQDLITRELRIENVGDEEMTEQLQMYDEELENDFKEFTSTKASAIKSLQDGIDLIRPTWSQLRGTELKSIITKVLRTFLLFLDPKSREGIWNHMDNWITHYASIVKEGKKNLSQSSFREVLVEVALKANPNEPLTSAAPSSPGRVKLPQESASASTATPASSSTSSSGSTPGKLSSTALPSGSSEKQSSSNSLPAPGKLAAPGPPPPAPSGPPPPPSSGGPPPPPGAPPPPGPPMMMGGPPPPPMMGGPPPPPMMGGPPLPPLPPGMGVPPPPGGPPPPPGMPMMGGPPLFPGLPPPPGPPPPPGMGFPPPPPGAPRPPGAPGLPPPLPGGPPPIPGMMFGASAGPVFPPRPAMTPWRWAPIPPRNIQGTVFKDLNPNAVELDESMIQDIFGMDNKKDEKKEDDKAKKKAEPVAQPKVLSQQRCTVLEIVVKRFDQPSGLIRDAILNGHFDRLSIQKLHELKSLFPPKSFDEDKKALSEYTGDPKELLPVESFMRDLILIPRIVGRLNVLIYSHEYGGTLTSARDNMTILLKAVQELKNPAVAKLLEISLALGNYLNSGGKQPKAPAVGFKLASLLKMVDVQSRVQKGMTLMHFVVRMCEKNHPEILELPMIVENISKAAGAYQAYDVDKNAVEKIQRDFQSELAECDEKDGPLKKVIESCTGEIAKALDELTRQFKQVEDGIGFFGEKPDDIPAFFGNWDKFFQSLQKTVKQSIQLKKKAEDAKKKEEQEKKKSEEKAMLGKFVSAVRDDDKSPAGAKGSSEDEKPGIRRPGSRAQKAGNTEKMLDDIMGSISMDDDDGPPKAAKKSPAPAKRLGDISPKPTTTRIDYKPGARRAVDKDKDKDKDKPKEEVKEEEKEDVWVPVGGPEVKPDVSPKVARSPAQTRAAARETDKQQLFSFLKEKEKKKTTGTGPQ